jgi:hypothetical protein
MKSVMVFAFWLQFGLSYSQPIVGTWQVAKQSNCMSDELGDPSDTEKEMLEAMSSKAGYTPMTIRFNADGSGEENWKVLGRKKSASREKFLYRHDDIFLYFLDRRSRIITDTFIVEELTPSTLVIFNKARNCERSELIRVSDK